MIKTHSAQTLPKQDERMYETLKTIFFHGYHHNDFAITHALGHIICTTVLHMPMGIRCLKAIVVITGRAYCFHGTAQFCVHTNNICGEVSAHLYGEEQSF